MLTGHRGDPTHFPENTISSVMGAIACGVTAVEVDVRVTRDGALVLSHDATLERVAGKPVEVSRSDLDELRRVEFRGERIATLADIAEAVRGVTSLDLDVKVPGFEEEIVKEISDHGDIRRTLFTSFDPDVVSRFKLASPEVRTGLIEQAAFSEATEIAVEIGADCILPEVSDVDVESIRRAKGAKLAVVPWTVDDPSVALHLLQMGADGLVTNDPCGLAKHVLGWRAEVQRSSKEP